MVEFINIADLINPDTSNTYRQDNLAKQHKFPLGTLVEIHHADEEDLSAEDGLRLHVVGHSRDCDGTPLYSLGSWDEHDERTGYAAINGLERLYPPKVQTTFLGYGEESLHVVSDSKQLDEAKELLREAVRGLRFSSDRIFPTNDNWVYKLADRIDKFLKGEQQ